MMTGLRSNKTAFFKSWSFYDHEAEYPEMDALLNGLANVPELVISDIRRVLEILEKAELLFPKTIRLKDELRIEAPDSAAFCDQIAGRVLSDPTLLTVDKIGGEGIVFLPDGSKEKVENLVTLEDIRFCDRQFQLKTNFSIWLPLSMNLDLPQKWQPELALLNAERLSKALAEIRNAFQMDVEPDLDEVEKDDLIWTKGFTLYLDPDYLQARQEEQPFLTEEQLKLFTIEP